MAFLATNYPRQREGSLFPRLAYGSEEPTIIHKTDASRGTNPTAGTTKADRTAMTENSRCGVVIDDANLIKVLSPMFSCGFDEGN